MPKPTLTELVHEMERSVTILEEQVKGIDECDETGKRHSEELNRLNVEVSTLREKVGSIEKSIDLIAHRRWTLLVAICSSFLGGLLTLLIQLSLRGLPK